MATITYNANGGYYPPSPQTFTGYTTITSSTPSRTGYDFLGWATTSYATAATYSPGSSYSGGSVTLYAVWKIKTFTIRYNANGGSGGPVSQAKTWGDQNFTITTSEPTRAGRKFLGWSTSSSATVPMYKPGDKFTGNYDMLLYAVWDSPSSNLINIYNVVVSRCTSSGTISDTGTYARVTANYGYPSSVELSSIRIQYQTTTGGSWTTATTITNFNKQIDVVIGGSFSVTQKYSIKIEITDKSGNVVSSTATLPTQNYVIDFYAGGTGVCIGGAADRSGFVVDMFSLFNESVTFDGPQVSFVSPASILDSLTFSIGSTLNATNADTAGLPGTITYRGMDFIEPQSSTSSRPKFVSNIGIDNGYYLQLGNSSGAFNNFVRMNSSNQFEMYWTSNYPIMGDMGKTLFSGTWSPATSSTSNSYQTISNANKYRVFLIMIDSSGTVDYGNTAWAVAVRGDITDSSYRIAGGIFMPNSNPIYSDMYFRGVFITASGTSWNLRNCGQMGFGPSTTTPNWTKMYVRRIVGLI